MAYVFLVGRSLLLGSGVTLVLGGLGMLLGVRPMWADRTLLGAAWMLVPSRNRGH